MKHSKLLQWLLAPFFMFADGEDGGGGAVDRGDNITLDEPDADAQAKADADAEAERIKAEADAAAAEKEGKDDKKDSMIPVGRHKAMLDKAREERDALAAKIAQLEKGRATETVTADIKAIEDQVAAKEEEYNKLLVDGETEKATAVMREIRALERQIGDSKAEMKAQAATAQAVDRIRYDTVVERLEAAYPELNPDSESYDGTKVAEVMELSAAYQKLGHASHAALQKAVKVLMGANTAKQESAATVIPRVAAEDVEKAARTEAATKKALEAAKKTPPSTAKVGLDSDKAGGGAITAEDAMKMSQEKFAKLNEETLSRLRGDII